MNYIFNSTAVQSSGIYRYETISYSYAVEWIHEKHKLNEPPLRNLINCISCRNTVKALSNYLEFDIEQIPFVSSIGLNLSRFEEALIFQLFTPLKQDVDIVSFIEQNSRIGILEMLASLDD